MTETHKCRRLIQTSCSTVITVTPVKQRLGSFEDASVLLPVGQRSQALYRDPWESSLCSGGDLVHQRECHQKFPVEYWCHHNFNSWRSRSPWCFSSLTFCRYRPVSQSGWGRGPGSLPDGDEPRGQEVCLQNGCWKILDSDSQRRTAVYRLHQVTTHTKTHTHSECCYI